MVNEKSMEDIKRFVEQDPDLNGGYREILKKIGERARGVVYDQSINKGQDSLFMHSIKRKPGNNSPDLNNILFFDSKQSLDGGGEYRP